MCGICGQFNFASGTPVEKAIIQKMSDCMVHRGPDDEGTYISGSLGFGFRRLSIIDLEGGHQPMSDTDGSVWAVFNGEIYNFREIRSELEKYGHVFRTNSDTEVLVHGYKQWGFDVLEHLNGMFGLAIWDDRLKRLMIARDRMGIKFVYYTLKNGQLFFASEIRPLLGAINNSLSLDPVALNLFLRYRYTPSPFTLFENVHKLAPGTRMIIADGNVKIERWWNYKPEPFDPMPSPDEAEEELLGLYKKAMKRHLISDVPLGLLLSGGIDSALLLALMNEHGTQWKTFSVGYGDDYKNDELSLAARTADILSSEHFSVHLDRNIFEADLKSIIGLLEEPVATSSIVPMYHVCKRAKENVKVALVGQGPDELFGGYSRHLGVQYGKYWRSLPPLLKRFLMISSKSMHRMAALDRGFNSLDEPLRMKRYQQVFSIMPAAAIDGLFHDGILPPAAGDRILECWKDMFPLMQSTDELGGFQFLEVRSSLPDELLMYSDKLSMRHSLELRVPYLDYEIVQFVERLSASFKVNKMVRKWLHRRVCDRFLPQEIVKRKKVGFASDVVDQWFRQTLEGDMGDILNDEGSMIYKYLKYRQVQRLVQEHRSGKKDHHKIIFSLIVLDYWLQLFSS